jgi:prepilin-type processing-associated H-X9-DG protein
MDQRALYEKLRFNQVPNLYDSRGNLVTSGIVDDLEVMKCPSNPPAATSAVTTCYVVNTGQLDAAATASRPADFLQNGVFHTGTRASPDHPLTVMTAQYIAANDGLGTTLLMAENADARAWCDTAERWAGFTWHHADGQPGPPTANPVRSLGLNIMVGKSRAGKRQSSANGFARPSSHHPGGFNVVFCDSHTRFISDQISYGVYQALMTPMGAGARDNSDPAGPPLPAGHAATEKVNESDIR